MNIHELAERLKNKGRHDDTMLAHISPEEAEMLEMMGGSGTINPQTGLPEFFSVGGLAKPFKSIGKLGGKIGGKIGSLGGKLATTIGLPKEIGQIAPYAAAAYYGAPYLAGGGGAAGLGTAGWLEGISPTAKTLGLLGGLGLVNQMSQASLAKKAREQSYEDWEKYAFPSEKQISSSQMGATANLASQLQLARKRFLEGSASRGVRGGSGQIDAGLADIENRGLLTYANMLRDIEQLRYNPRFAPMQAQALGGALDPALSYLALAEGLKLTDKW